MNLLNKLSKFEIENQRIFPKDMNKGIMKNYKKVIDNNSYELYQAGYFDYKIVAAFKSVIVCRKNNENTFYIYPNYCNHKIKYKISMNSKNFPGLIKNSKISEILIIPFLRKTNPKTLSNRWRVVVITDKAQIYHNFPDRETQIAGMEKVNDIKRFEESAIWDIPGRKFPTNNVKHDDIEEYKPYLPLDCYEYHPKINIKSKYGNNGFDKYTYVNDKGSKVKVSRFYIPDRKLEANPFIFMGGFEPDYKLTLLATYRENKSCGVRTCIFATSDGGRNWYAKFEFDDLGDYAFKQGDNTWGYNFGNKIYSKLFKQEYNHKADILMRKINFDSNEVEWQNKNEILKIYLKDSLFVKTKQKHGYETGNIIKIIGNIVDDNWNLIVNGSDDKNNYNLFKVEKIDDYTLKLYEFVSDSKSLIPCRHIHHINRVRDGWVVGTGETYPNGWLLYIQMKEADTYSTIDASDELKIRVLNSSINSVQRTIGVDIIENDDINLIVFASDHDKLPRTCNKIKELSRGSTGIYVGNLKDIDNIDNYKIIYEAKEPAFFFKKLNNKYVFCGQRGELSIGNYDFSNWTTNYIERPLIHYKGQTYTFCVIDEYILIIK